MRLIGPKCTTTGTTPSLGGVGQATVGAEVLHLQACCLVLGVVGAGGGALA